jgi:hypothetical protein
MRFVGEFLEPMRMDQPPLLVMELLFLIRQQSGLFDLSSW